MKRFLNTAFYTVLTLFILVPAFRMIATWLTVEIFECGECSLAYGPLPYLEISYNSKINAALMIILSVVKIMIPQIIGYFMYNLSQSYTKCVGIMIWIESMIIWGMEALNLVVQNVNLGFLEMKDIVIGSEVNMTLVTAMLWVATALTALEVFIMHPIDNIRDIMEDGVDDNPNT